MNPDEKITSAKTDENRPDSSGDSTAEPPVLPEKSPQAENQPQDQVLLNTQSTSASSQDAELKSSEIINVSQELNLPTEKQSSSNPPQSSSQCVASNLKDVELKIVETLISSEPKFQFENQPSASQSVPKLCVDDKFSIKSDSVEIPISPQNESQIEQQFEHSETENRGKEDKNIVIQRAEDAIEVLSYALPSSPTNPSSSEVEKGKNEDSCMMKFLKSRINTAWKQLKRLDYLVFFCLCFILQVVYISIYTFAEFIWGGYDIYYSIVVANPICWTILLFVDRNLLTEKFYSFFTCFKRHEAKPLEKKSKHTPRADPNAAFQHEVADLEKTDPQNLPRILQRTQESLDPGSPCQAVKQPLITNVDVHKENSESPEYEGASRYPSAFASGACGYSPGLGEESSHFIDRPHESQMVLNVDVRKANNESDEDPAEAESQIVINVDVHKEHESSENPAEAARGRGYSSGAGGEKASHDP